MKKDIWQAGLLILLMIIALLYSARSMTLVLVFIPAVLITFFVYLRTWRKEPPAFSEIVVPYLLALGIQCLHFAEEFITGFHYKIPEFLGLSALPVNDMVVFNMVAYGLFIAGGLAFHFQSRPFMVIPLFFIVAGLFFNTIAHILIALVALDYMPGLISVLLYLPLFPKFLKLFRVNETH